MIRFHVPHFGVVVTSLFDDGEENRGKVPSVASRAFWSAIILEFDRVCAVGAELEKINI